MEKLPLIKNNLKTLYTNESQKIMISFQEGLIGENKEEWEQKLKQKIDDIQREVDEANYKKVQDENEKLQNKCLKEFEAFSKSEIMEKLPQIKSNLKTLYDTESKIAMRSFLEKLFGENKEEWE